MGNPAGGSAMSEAQLDPQEQRVIDDVRRYGCHVVNVLADEPGEAEFSYTVGLPVTLRQPEAIVFALKKGLRQSVLNALLSRLRDGLKLSDGLRIPGLIEGHDCVARRISSPEAIRDHFGWAIWFHRAWNGTPITEAYQIVWPDSGTGLFPGDEGCDPGLAALQPALYDAGSTA